MRWNILLAVSLLCVAGSAMATELNINLGADTAEIGVRQQLAGRASGTTRVGASILFNDDDDIVGSGYLQIIGDLERGFEPLEFGAGVKAYVADLGEADTTIGALGIGGLVRLEITQTDMPLAVVLEGYMAPEITSTGPGRGVVDLTARVEARFARNASVYVGYRYLEFDVEDAGDPNVDDDFMVGLRLSF